MQVTIKRDNTKTISGVVNAGPIDLPVTEAIRLINAGEADAPKEMKPGGINGFARVNGMMKSGMVR